MATLRDYAQAYHDRLGWAVVPIMPGTKRPRGEWTASQYRRLSLRVFDAKYQPGDGLGIVQGPHSCIAIDIDGATTANWLRLEFPNVPWDLFPTVETGSGGLHIYAPFPSAWQSLVDRGVARVALLTGDKGSHTEVSVHLARSITVAPPSIHPNGRPYRWRVAPHLPLPTLTNPAFLTAVVNAAAAQETPIPKLRQAAAPYADGPEKMLRWLEARGIRPLGSRKAPDRMVFYVPCPWSAQHSVDGDATATAVFWSPITVGFRCLHAHCAERTWTDLARLPQLPLGRPA